jgi:hypothetical protein
MQSEMRRREAGFERFSFLVFLGIYLLKPFPFIPVNSTSTQNLGEKVSTDVTLMRVGDHHPDLSLDHVLVFSTHIRAFKPQFP